MSGHHSASSITVEYITPPEITDVLGPFGTDPCSPQGRPWDTAKIHYTKADDGLQQLWYDRVWLNPPYGSYEIMAPWLSRLSGHGNGIALLFARTETNLYFDYVWNTADSILFMKGRLTFYIHYPTRLMYCQAMILHNRGVVKRFQKEAEFLQEQILKGNIWGPAMSDSGGATVLIAYGDENVGRLEDSGIDGKHQLLKTVPVILIGVSTVKGPWRSVVTITMARIGRDADLQVIYALVKKVAPEKVAGNPNYKAKVRQQLQFLFKRVAKGIYTNEKRTIKL